MDSISLIRSYERYLHLVSGIYDRMRIEWDAAKFSIHVNYDVINVFYVDGSPGEIFSVYRRKNMLAIRDLTIQRSGSDDFDGNGLDLSSPDSDDQLIEDVIYLLNVRLPETIARQRRCWQIEQMRISADDGEPIEDD